LHAMQALSQLSYGPILERTRSRRAGRAFQALIFILVEHERIIVIIVVIDAEGIVIIIGENGIIIIVVVIVDAFLGEAGRHLGAGRLFLVVLGRAFEDHFGFFAAELLGIFFVVDFVFVVVIAALALNGNVLVLVVIVVIVVRLDGRTGSFCLHLRDRGLDDLVFRIEFVTAFGANSGAFVEVVKAGFAVWADLLGSEFVFRHGAAPSEVSMILVWAGACHERRALSKPEFM
jgi:hypothetical protein